MHGSTFPADIATVITTIIVNNNNNNYNNKEIAISGDRMYSRKKPKMF